MKDYEIHETIMEHLCNEIGQIAESMKKNQSMSMQDLEKLDKMYHLKKGMLACKAMEESESENEEGWSSEGGGGGNSGRRGRSRTTGRYVSRDNWSGMDAQSYADGYSQGYSEAMSQMSNAAGGNSGHYPFAPYPPRRF